MEEKRNINEQMLLDYYSDSLSSAQRQMVEEWISNSEENLKTARDIQYICKAIDTLQTINMTDSAKALSHIKRKMNKTGKYHLLYWIQRIAAIISIPLIINTLYLINKEEPIENIEIRTNPGMTAKVHLSDGSDIWLNSQSYLKYPRKFTGTTREVEIDGEAYFSIHKDEKKRFIVNTPFDLKAEVLGTEFNIEAYKEERQITTTLVSGSVRLIYQNKNKEKESLIMKPNDEVKYNPQTKNIRTQKTYVQTYTAWKDGIIIFRDTPFEEALKILSKRFNTEFIIMNAHLYDNSYTGTFDAQHLDLVLEHFRLSSGIQYKFIVPETGKNKFSRKTIVELY